MKALTLKHPWAFAICYWGKRIENRVWRPRTELKIGERFAIHGGRPPGATNGYRLEAVRIFADLFNAYGQPPAFDDMTTYRELMHIAINESTGIVATAILDSVVTESDDPWFQGPLGWVLRDVIVMPNPIQCKGAQGLFGMIANDAQDCSIFARACLLWTGQRSILVRKITSARERIWSSPSARHRASMN